MEESEAQWRIHILIECVLYKQVSSLCEPYMRENMSVGYKHEVCAKVMPTVVDVIQEFCAEEDAKPMDVIKKLKSCLPSNIEGRVCSEQYQIVEQILTNLEQKAKKQEKEQGER